MAPGSKTVGRVSTILTGERSPGKRGIIPTAVLGTGVLGSLTALTNQTISNAS